MNRFLKRGLYAGSAVFCGAIIVGANQASADDGGSAADNGQAQELVLDNTASQDGAAGIDNYQINLNVPVAVLSPGANAGDVEQSNTATNNAAVTNTNSTEQTADQSQSADANATGGDASGNGDGGDAAATVEQDQAAAAANETNQGGDAQVDNNQLNVNLPIAVLSPGANAGDVEQSNTATNNAAVTNTNSTEQTADQSQSADANATGDDASGNGDGGDAAATVEQDQAANLANETNQGGSATVHNTQENLNEPAAEAPAGHPGDPCDSGCPSPAPATSGDVDQSNAAVNAAEVDNRNTTIQDVDQSHDAEAAATGGNAEGDGNGYDRDRCGCPDDHDSGSGGDADAVVVQDQVAGTDNSTIQGGSATVDSTQDNVNEATNGAPAGHPGNPCNSGCPSPTPTPSGDVGQSNTADNASTVDNRNTTSQAIDQSQQADASSTGGDAEGDGDDRDDDDRCGCPGDHDGGNGGIAEAAITQSQAAAESNHTSQGGSATIDTTQDNVNEASTDKPSKKSFGKGGRDCGCPAASSPAGDVDQSNVAGNSAAVDNRNATDQGVGQSQAASADAIGGVGSDNGKGDGNHGNHGKNGKRDCGCPKSRSGGDGGDAIAEVVQSQHADIGDRTDQGGDANVHNDQRNRNGGRWMVGNVGQSNGAGNAAALGNGSAGGQSGAQGQLARALANAR